MSEFMRQPPSVDIVLFPSYLVLVRLANWVVVD